MMRYYLPKDDRVMLMIAIPQRGKQRGLLKTRCRGCLTIKSRLLQVLVGRIWWLFGIGGRV